MTPEKKAKPAKKEKAKRTRHSEEDKSFARRAKPSKEDSLHQWQAIRDAFNSEIAMNVVSPGSHQDPVYNSIMYKFLTCFCNQGYTTLIHAGAILAAGEASAG